MKHCPTCTCGNCKSQEQTIWQRGKDSLDSYPGLHKPAAKNISKVTRNQSAETYYIDRTSQGNRLPPAPVQFPSPQQKKQIIDICKRDKSNQEICGVIDRQGRVHQLPNISHKDKRNTFNLDYKSKGIDAIAIWHRHLAANGHSGDVSGGDVEMAKERGVSMLMVYDEGRDDMPYEQYTWGEFHPKGIPQIRAKTSTPSTPSHPPALQSQPQSLRERIIEAAKHANRKSAVGGLVLANGEVTLERNLTPKNPASFRFKWRDKPAVGFWHLHQEREGHPQQIGQEDIRVAQESGLSCYMVFQGKHRDDYQVSEYHPRGTPTTYPRLHYDICFSCPTDGQLEEIIQESNACIKEENQRYRKEVSLAYQEAQQLQQQTLKDLNEAALATQNFEDKSRLFANKYQMIGERNNVNLEQVIRRQPVQESRISGVQQPRASKTIAGSSAREADNCEVNFQGHRARHKDFAE